MIELSRNIFKACFFYRRRPETNNWFLPFTLWLALHKNQPIIHPSMNTEAFCRSNTHNLAHTCTDKNHRKILRKTRIFSPRIFSNENIFCQNGQIIIHPFWQNIVIWRNFSHDLCHCACTHVHAHNAQPHTHAPAHITGHTMRKYRYQK